jgi:hypothetical protein
VAVVEFFRKDILNPEVGGIVGIKAYIYNNEFGSFDAYKNNLKNNLVRDLVKSNYSASFNIIEINRKNGLISETEAANQISALNEEVDREVVRLSGHYSFADETVGGASVIFHKRDFYGFIGNIHEMHVDLNNARVLVFHSEADGDIVDRIYHSFKILK